jgi:hypothetical protein
MKADGYGFLIPRKIMGKEVVSKEKSPFNDCDDETSLLQPHIAHYRGACSTYGGKERCVQDFGRET